METTDYKKGDVVLLNDGYRYKYLGEVPLSDDRTSHAYRPLDGKTDYAAEKKDEGELVPFAHKVSAEVVSAEVVSAEVVSAEVVGAKGCNKLLRWFLESNRWKHFLYAIPAGAINFWLAVGLALGMEFKDAQHGGKFDWVDATCTAVGGFVGAALSWWLSGNYVLHYLIKLIF